jgi:hypothetical protein
MVASSNQQETDTQKFELSDNELSCEELDRVSGGIKGAVEGVCSKDEVMGGGGPMGMFNQIMQQVQQMQPR